MSTLDPLFSSSFSVGEIRAAVEEAERFDTYVLVHTYLDADIRRCLELGVKSIEHGHLIQEETMKLLVQRDAFLVLNTAGFSPSQFLHPNLAPGTPSGKKLRQLLADTKNLAPLIKKYKPKVVHSVDTVLATVEQARSHRDHEKWMFANMFGNFEALKSMTSTAGELMALSGKRNPYQDGKLGVIKPGAYADILVVDGNPLEDLSVLGANEKYLDAKPREASHKTIRLIMKDGKVYKNTLK